MKKLIFYKPTHQIQLGHLYEHIYCAALAEYLRGCHLFDYVDYYIEGKTYYTGYIRIEVNLYSQKAHGINLDLNNIQPKFNDKTVPAGMLQIIAEKFADVEEYSDDSHQELKKLSSQPWVSLNSLSILPKNIRLNTKSFKLTDVSESKFGIIKQQITVPSELVSKSPEIHLPVFAEVAYAMRANLQETIANNSYCFSYDDTFKLKPVPTDINYYRKDKREAAVLTDEVSITRSLISAMKTQGFIDRLYQYLHAASLDKPMQCPDEELILEKTGYVVGPNFWKERVSKKILSEVFENMIIEFKLGRSVDSVKVRDV